MKWYVWLICGVLIFGGIFCGMRLHTLWTAESYVNGSIDIENQFKMESFFYTNSSVVFYNDLYNNPENYSFETDLLVVESFDGQKNTYEVVLNNYIILATQISAGSVVANFYLDFYNTDGVLIHSAKMIISIKFLSNKTVLNISTNGGTNASFLTQYFHDNGIRLQINEIKGGI